VAWEVPRWTDEGSPLTRASFFSPMYLLYMDASGSPLLGSGEECFVTLGLCIHEGTWYAFQSRMDGVRRKFARPGESPEIHAKDFCCSITEQDQIAGFEGLDWPARAKAVSDLRAQKVKSSPTPKKRRSRLKKYKSTEPWAHLTRSERNELYTAVLDLVGSHDGVRLFCQAIDKSHHFTTSGERDVSGTNFTQVITRFEAFLNRTNSSATNHGVDKGLLVMDNEPSHESTFRSMLDRFRREGHPWGELRHVIETPFFVDSVLASAIQAADVCAYAVRRYFLKQAAAGSPEEQNFLRIYHRFDREGARLHGVRHYCRRGSCQCQICEARGHASGQDPDELKPLG